MLYNNNTNWSIDWKAKMVNWLTLENGSHSQIQQIANTVTGKNCSFF